MLGTIGVVGAALFYGLIGTTAIIRPTHLLRGFGIAALQPESRNEIRGVYGGLPLTMAGLLLFSLSRPDLSNGILLALALCTAGFAFGRFVSALIDRTMGKHPAIWAALELVVAVLIASNIKGV